MYVQYILYSLLSRPTNAQHTSIYIVVMFMYSYCYVRSVLYILFPSCQLVLFGYSD